jgi:hypothetical protein
MFHGFMLCRITGKQKRKMAGKRDVMTRKMGFKTGGKENNGEAVLSSGRPACFFPVTDFGGVFGRAG